MPMRAPSRCRTCHRLHTAARCPTCAAARYPAHRGVYYSRAWRSLRDQVLSEEPLCRNCRGLGPFQVDHIIPLTVAPRLALTRSNLQALCEPCHGRKTRNE